MAMFTILLVTVVVSMLPSSAVELVLDHPEKCMLHRPFRTILNKFHNELRQSVGQGEAVVKGNSLGPAREMYGLVYDCSLEEEASHEMTLPGFAALYNRGVISFSGEYKGSANTALEKILPTLYDDENSLRQVTIRYNHATKLSGRPSLQQLRGDATRVERRLRPNTPSAGADRTPTYSEVRLYLRVQKKK
ncbi:hypothetical protein Y032_0222g2623 [Ancylostoma ceylanicum]|nr:hypothetical protein Y032_0222g2623 [Ancylostoma ceylanicum]